MNKRFTSLARTLALGSLLGVPALAPLAAQNTDTQGAKSDNTKVNKRDRAPSAVTADQQKENTSDRETARKIRRAVVQDKSLSTYAHNVKIVAHGGTV
ncbi:MAG: BON domain-containing protein, partial [Acidobacteriota bacterium]|nr:BON domain-containing protein [Acidobacteriota bacterium]